jgi:hypothetical protein
MTSGVIATAGDAGEVAGGVVGDVRVGVRADGERARAGQGEDIPVRLGARDVERADGGIGAGAVVHEHRGAQELAEARRDDPRDGIVRAARQEADDHLDGTLGIGLRLAVAGGERGARGGGPEHVAAGDLVLGHFFLLGLLGRQSSRATMPFMLSSGAG